MFGVDGVEILVCAIAALIFIGPKQLPEAMRTVGRWVGKMRGYARHFNAGIESVMREAELEAMEKEWREQNARIMAQYPGAYSDPEPKAADKAEDAEADEKPERDLP